MISNIKGSIAFILTLVLLTACGGPVETNSEENSKDRPEELAQGVTDEEILIGTLGPQTGPIAIYDTIREGVQAYVNYVNEEGDIHGRKLKLIAYDDQYQPAKTVQQAKKLVGEDKVFALVAPAGSSQNIAAKNYYEEVGIPVVMASTGTSAVVNPPNPVFFGTTTTSYSIEGKILLEYAATELGAKTISIVYQNDDFGKEGFEAIKENIDNYNGVEIVAEIPYVAGDTDFSSHTQHIVKADADVTIALAVPNAAANLKKELYKHGYKDKPFIVSQVGANDKNQFNIAGEDIWEGTISTTPILMYDVSDDPMADAFVKQMEKDFPNSPITGFAQIGWAACQVFVEALERTGPEPTWDKFKEALYTFENWDGSMNASVTFTPNNHYGINSVYMTEARKGQIVPISGLYTYNPETGEISYDEN